MERKSPARTDQSAACRISVPAPAGKRADGGAASGPGDLFGKHLLELCREIAGAIIRRNLSRDDCSEIRAEIRAGLVEHLECDRAQAESLIDLSLELIRMKAYGKYRRNDLEMAALIAAASGLLSEVGAN